MYSLKSLIQRVSKAEVLENNKVITKIQKGIIVYMAFIKNEDNENANWEAIINKFCLSTLKCPLFSNHLQKTKLSITDIKGDILLISQFTLAARMYKGKQIDFSKALNPELSKTLFKNTINSFKSNYIENKIYHNCFGKYQQILSINDGPFSFILNID